MAQMQPKNLKSLAKLSGITEYKLNKYGNYFIEEITYFLNEENLTVALPTTTQMKTLQLYQQGLTIPEIAKERGFAVSTIITHISELIELNQSIDIDKFVLSKKKEVIIKTIKEMGDQSLKSLKEKLGDNYSYDEIKLVKAWYQRKKN
jgi:ATP-dependent DNA helicase RecQ